MASNHGLGGVTNIDRRQCTRVVPMRCLVLGLGRTGTKYADQRVAIPNVAVYHALRMLGFNETYHMESAVTNPQDSDLWFEALKGKFEGGTPFGRREWDQLLGHCQAVTDFPAAMFAPELIATYPEAKVVLTVRDIDSWYKSVLKTIEWRYRDPVFYALTFVDRGSALWGRMFYKMWEIFSHKDFVKEGKQAYHEHYAQVRRLVPAENLLEFHPREGWEPLCKFLDVDVPSTTFPAGNTQDDFHQKLRTLDKRRASALLAKAAPGLLLVFAIAAYTYSRY